MMEYYNKLKNEAVFVWIFVKGELVSPKDDYKEFLTRIYVKARSLFINKKGKIIAGEKIRHDFN